MRTVGVGEWTGIASAGSSSRWETPGCTGAPGRGEPAHPRNATPLDSTFEEIASQMHLRKLTVRD